MWNRIKLALNGSSGKCIHCKEKFSIYYTPRTLPCCNQVICHKCSRSIEKISKSGSYKCVLCNVDKDLPIGGFQKIQQQSQESPVIEAELCKELVKNPERQKSIESSELEEAVQMLLFDVNNQQLNVREYFNEQRNLIQQATQEKINAIYNYRNLLLQQLSEYEKKIFADFSSSKIFENAKKVINDANLLIQKQNEFLNQMKISVDEAILLNSTLKKFKTIVNEERNNIKLIKFNAKIHFQSAKTQHSQDMLGYFCLENVTSNKNKLLSCPIYESIRLWDLNTGKRIQTFEESNDLINHVRFLNETQIVSCSQEGLIKIWDVSSGNCLNILIGHTEEVLHVDLLPNNWLVSCSWDKTIRVWSLETGACLKLIKDENKLRFLKAINNDLLLVCSGKLIKLFDLNAGESIRDFIGHEYLVNCVDELNDEKIASVSNKSIRIWNFQTAECIQRLEGHSDAINCMITMPDDTIVTGSSDNTIKLWDWNRGTCIRTLNGHSNFVKSISVISDHRICSGSYDNTIKIWSLESGECIQTLEENRPVFCVQVL